MPTFKLVYEADGSSSLQRDLLFKDFKMDCNQRGVPGYGSEGPPEIRLAFLPLAVLDKLELGAKKSTFVVSDSANSVTIIGTYRLDSHDADTAEVVCEGSPSGIKPARRSGNVRAKYRFSLKDGRLIHGEVDWSKLSDYPAPNLHQSFDLAPQS